MAAWPVRGEGAGAAAGGPWPHAGELVRDGGWAAWRQRGNLTASRVDSPVARLAEARRRLE